MSVTQKESRRHARIVASVAGAITFSLLASACGSEATTLGSPAVDTTTSTLVEEVQPISAAEGATARAAQAAARGGIGQLQTSALAAESSIVSSDFAGDCGVPYEPSPEDLATANADTQALATVLDTYGISYQSNTDDYGFVFVEYDYADVVAQSVVDSFWQSRYPVDDIEIEPISDEELARQTAEIDAVIAALESVGASYTRMSDEAGWEWVEWDYDNDDARAAVDAVYEELYPPIPPSPEDIAVMTTENERLASAFDAAGIEYTIARDTAGWEWIEWDYDDESIQDAVAEVFTELYPVEPGIICDDVIAEDLPLESGVAELDSSESVVVDDAATSGLAPADSELTVVEEFTPEQVAQRDAEVEALATGFADAGVDHDVWGESPWASVTFDISNDDAIEVVADVLATRG